MSTCLRSRLKKRFHSPASQPPIRPFFLSHSAVNLISFPSPCCCERNDRCAAFQGERGIRLASNFTSFSKVSDASARLTASQQAVCLRHSQRPSRCCSDGRTVTLAISFPSFCRVFFRCETRRAGATITHVTDTAAHKTLHCTLLGLCGSDCEARFLFNYFVIGLFPLVCLYRYSLVCRSLGLARRRRNGGPAAIHGGCCLPVLHFNPWIARQLRQCPAVALWPGCQTASLAGSSVPSRCRRRSWGVESRSGRGQVGGTGTDTLAIIPLHNYDSPCKGRLPHHH